MGEADTRQCPECYIYNIVNNYWQDTTCQDCGTVIRPKLGGVKIKLIDEFLESRGLELTDRRKEVITEFISSKKTNEEIADSLYISTKTIDKHLLDTLQDTEYKGRVRRSVLQAEYIKFLEEKLGE